MLTDVDIEKLDATQLVPFYGNYILDSRNGLG